MQHLIQTDFGIVRLLLYEARGLEQSISRKTPSPRILVQCVDNGEEQAPLSMFSTPVCRETTDPVWNSCYDFICGKKLETTLLLHVFDASAKRSNLGYMTIPLRDLLDMNETDTVVWWPLSGSSKGQVKMRAEWRAVAISNL